MKGKITKIEASRKRGTRQGVKHSKDLYAGRILSYLTHKTPSFRNVM